MTERLLRAALFAYPAAARRRDGAIIVDCALDMSADGSSFVRELAGILRGGLDRRLGATRAELAAAPWVATLDRLAVPLAAGALAVWAVGGLRAVVVLSPGLWWSCMVAAALLTFAGAVTRVRPLAVGGWTAQLALLAHSLWQSNVLHTTGSDFSAGFLDGSVDFTAAFLPLLGLGLASAVALRGRRRPADLAWAVPAIALGAVSYARIGEMWATPPAEAALVVGLFAAPAVAFLRAGPAAAALLLAVAAPEAIWLATGFLPYPGPAGALAVLAGGGLLAAAAVVALARRGGRRRIE